MCNQSEIWRPNIHTISTFCIQDFVLVSFSLSSLKMIHGRWFSVKVYEEIKKKPCIWNILPWFEYLACVGNHLDVKN